MKSIIPISSDNCVIKPSIIDAKIDKWQKIANEAVKQCERTDFPKISMRSTLENFIKSSDFGIKIACVERGTDTSLKACLRSLDIKENTNIAILIGPEGGFSAREIDMLNKSKDIYKVGLGNLILRAETAVISSLSNTIYELEHDK